MNAPKPVEPAQGKRNRTAFLMIVALFFGTMVVAGILRFSGWKPEGLKSNGHLIDPALDARQLPPVQSDGVQYAWRPHDRRWRLLVIAPESACDSVCERDAAGIDKIWQMVGQDAERVDVLWAGSAPQQTKVHQLHVISPQAEMLGLLPENNRKPTAAGLPVYMIDPNGFVMMEYKPGADIGGIRADLAKVLKLR